MSRTNRTAIFSNDEFAHRKATQFSGFLKLLIDANEYAIDLMSSPWEFAIRFDQASDLNLTLNDLCWMTRRGWIHCQPDNAICSAGEFESTDFFSTAKFVISKAGASAFHNVATFEHQSGVVDLATTKNTVLSDTCTDQLVPEWDVARRELSVLGKVVKRFRWPAPNQETIINVFAEEGWPPRIEDPLPQGHGLDPKRRLGDTIKCLNRNQKTCLIRFRGDGTGEGVLWDLEEA